MTQNMPAAQAVHRVILGGERDVQGSRDVVRAEEDDREGRMTDNGPLHEPIAASGTKPGDDKNRRGHVGGSGPIGLRA